MATQRIQQSTYSVCKQMKNLGNNLKETNFQSSDIEGRFERARLSLELPVSYTEIYGISQKVKLKSEKLIK